MHKHLRALTVSALFLSALVFSSGGCVRQLVINTAVDALGGDNMSAGSFARDDDPELIGEALPFGLKVMESLLDETPRHRGLLIALAAGFTQYAQGFVLPRSQGLPMEQADKIKTRVVKLHLRAHRYALRALQLAHPEIVQELQKNPVAAAQELQADDLDAMYWASASLMAAVSLATDDMQLVSRLPQAEALAKRALKLNPDWGQGSLHELFISYEGRSPSLGGSAKRAREHFRRAIALSHGLKASVYVALAEAVAVPEQNKREFIELLDKALAIDLDAAPDNRLANSIAQQQARWLKTQVDDLIL